MRILFVDGTQGHDPHKHTSRPTGGILNSLTVLPEYLVKQGHEVYVRSSFDKDEIVNGVRYVRADQIIPKWDVTVFNRNVLPKDFMLYCKEQGSKIIWWLHDVVQLTYLNDDAFTLVDRVVALSEYNKKTYSEFYSIDPKKFTVIPNGIDPKIFYPGDYTKRNKHLCFTASAPIKGIIPVQSAFQNLLRADPDIDFRVYSSNSLHLITDTVTHQQFLTGMEKLGAHVYHPVSPEVLGHLLRTAWCLLMPNSYPEMCSNLLLQARACGCPVIASHIGANAEFLGTNLVTKKYNPHDQAMWVVEYTNLVLDLFENDKLHKQISEDSQNGVLTWDQIGEKWNELLKNAVE